jgi:membrane-associated phospholipid phosphatase
LRPYLTLALSLSLLGGSAGAQLADTSRADKVFFTKHDLVLTGLAFGATGLISVFDDNIARWSQQPRFQDSSTHHAALNISKVNETTITIAGLASYGIARLSGSKTATDITLHTTEAVLLASFSSQVIRGLVGRTRPYVTHDSNQYDFHFGRGFYGHNSFDYRSFPSIHTSSSIALATALTMETNLRHPRATPYVAPILFIAGILPGLARVNLDQHWASDIAAGAFMGAIAGYKVVSYSHANPNNRFDRMFLRASVVPDSHGGILVLINPTF